MNYITTLLFILFFTMQMAAQEKKLTLHDLLPGGNSHQKHTPRTLKQLQWWGDRYSYTRGDSTYAVTPEKKSKPQLLFTLEELKSEGINTLPTYRFPSPKQPWIEFTAQGKHYRYNFQTKLLTTLYEKSGENHTDEAPTGSLRAFTRENNLFVADGNEEPIPITEEPKGVLCGQSVHQHEFGISKGTFWSPDGKALAFYRMDERMVSDYPLVDISARVASLHTLKYPMAGMKSHEVTLGVWRPDSGVVYLKTGAPKEKYLTNVAWSPDSKTIYLLELNRGQDSLILTQYNAQSGKRVATLFEESNPKYVEPQTPIQFLPNRPDHFVYQSQRDGFNHLYLYNTKGELLNQLTSGNWMITKLLGFDATGEELIYQSTETSPLERAIYKVEIKSGKRTLLTPNFGTNASQLSPSGRHLLNNFSNSSTPRIIQTIEVATGKCNPILTATNPFARYEFPEIILDTLTAADGVTPLYTRMVRPANFDSTKRYPTILYVYGGPHAQMVTNSWMSGTRGWEIYMAQRGYIVFTLDNRGSANRGFEFESIIHRQLGAAEMADQMKGVSYLQTLPYVDNDRIGIHGWSFGGFMTINLMLTHPDIFKVGVAGGPVTDWSLYEIMYGERYMDSPKENPEGYKAADLTLRAGNLKGELLVVHCDEDPVVLLQHSLRFVDAAIKNDAYPDLFIYPGHKHNVVGPDRVHLYEKVTRYFEKNLR